MSKNGLFKGLNKNIIVLSVTSFFTDISSEMLYPDEGILRVGLGQYPQTKAVCNMGVLTLFASIIAGLLWSYIGKSAPFIYGAITGVISAILCVFLL